MNTTPAHGRTAPRPSRTAPRPNDIRPLSMPLAASAAALFLLGVGSGAVSLLNRSPIREEHVAGTAAWGPHIVLALLTAIVVAIVARRRPGALWPLLLAPVRTAAARRLRYTIGAAARRPAVAARLLLSLPAIALLLYGPYRFGVQVLGGLDPNFTVNAWGGPTYLGAMACHYLDGALTMAAAAWLLDRLLPLPDSE